MRIIPSTSTGFVMYPSIPASRAAFLSSAKAFAVIAITGIRVHGSPSARIFLAYHTVQHDIERLLHPAQITRLLFQDLFSIFPVSFFLHKLTFF